MSERAKRAGASAWLLASASALLGLGIGELALRALPGRFEPPADERLAYRYDETLGWFPRESSQGVFRGPRTIRLRHNSQGFRDVEHGAKQSPRIAFLGDSFVWGYDAEQEERFTEQLRPLLPEWEILNLGVSGYGTDQEYLLSQRVLPAIKPDLVFLMYSLNDSRDNTSNFRYDAYYKPYFVKESGALRLQGVPVPKALAYRLASHPLLAKSEIFCRLVAALFPNREEKRRVPEVTTDLLLAERALVESLGGRLVIGFVETHKRLLEFCANAGIPHLEFDEAEQYPVRGHWTPAGHAFVARRLRDFVAQQAGTAAKP